MAALFVLISVTGKYIEKNCYNIPLMTKIHAVNEFRPEITLCLKKNLFENKNIIYNRYIIRVGL